MSLEGLSPGSPQSLVGQHVRLVDNDPPAIVHIHNPFDERVDVVVTAELPRFLAERGWLVRIGHRDGEATVGLSPRGVQKLTVSLRPGNSFTAEELVAAGEQDVRVTASGNGIVIGGMTYRLDPGLDRAPIETEGAGLVPLDHPDIEFAIRDAERRRKPGLREAAVRRRTESADVTGNGETGRILSELGLPDEIRRRVQRLSVREVTVDIAPGDDR